MTTYIIRPYESGPAANLYVICEQDAEQPELEKSLLALHGSTCTEDERHICRRYYPDTHSCSAACGRADLASIAADVLGDAIDRSGFSEHLFRPQDNYKLPTRALGIGPIRIYGLRFGDGTLFVAGGGKTKFVEAIHDDRELANRYFYVVERIRLLLIPRLKAISGIAIDRDGLPVPPRDHLGRLYLPDSVLHPF